MTSAQCFSLSSCTCLLLIFIIIRFHPSLTINLGHLWTLSLPEAFLGLSALTRGDVTSKVLWQMFSISILEGEGTCWERDEATQPMKQLKSYFRSGCTKARCWQLAALLLTLGCALCLGRRRLKKALLELQRWASDRNQLTHNFFKNLNCR